MEIIRSEKATKKIPQFIEILYNILEVFFPKLLTFY